MPDNFGNNLNFAAKLVESNLGNGSIAKCIYVGKIWKVYVFC